RARSARIAAATNRRRADRSFGEAENRGRGGAGLPLGRRRKEREINYRQREQLQRQRGADRPPQPVSRILATALSFRHLDPPAPSGRNELADLGGRLRPPIGTDNRNRWVPLLH